MVVMKPQRTIPKPIGGDIEPPHGWNIRLSVDGKRFLASNVIDGTRLNTDGTMNKNVTMKSYFDSKEQIIEVMIKKGIIND